MNKNIMIFIDYKIHKIDNLISMIKDYFNTSVMKVSNENYILALNNDNIIFDITLKHIKCIIDKANMESNTQQLTNFLSDNFKDQYIGIHYFNSEDNFIKPKNVKYVRV